MKTSLEMDDFRDGNVPDRTDPMAVASGPKRDYEPPELVVWGSMINLTLGPEFFFDDVEGGGSDGL